jgi:uncharacterized protein
MQKQKEQAIATLHRLDQVLANQLYIAGDRFTVADITTLAGTAYNILRMAEVPVGKRDFMMHLVSFLKHQGNA